MLEFIVELNKQIDDSLCKIDILNILGWGFDWFEKIHDFDYSLNDDSKVAKDVLFLLYDRNLDGLDHSQDPVLSLNTLSLVLYEL